MSPSNESSSPGPRAHTVEKSDVFGRFECKARAVLDALLSKCADNGVLNLEDKNILRAPPFSDTGMPVGLIRAFSGKPRFENAVHELQDAIYQEHHDERHR